MPKAPWATAWLLPANLKATVSPTAAVMELGEKLRPPEPTLTVWTLRRGVSFGHHSESVFSGTDAAEANIGRATKLVRENFMVNVEGVKLTRYWSV